MVEADSGGIPGAGEPREHQVTNLGEAGLAVRTCG